MSGIVGHTMYAILGAKAAQQRKSPIAPILHRHFSSYLAGSYLGCDVPTMPAATCIDTGEDVGYGSMQLEKSPLTGGKVIPWKLKHGGWEYIPKEIGTMLYGRSHLVFGWNNNQTENTLPWDHLADYVADVIGDAIELFGAGDRKIAYCFGWLTHVIGDSLIKSVRPGIDLYLLKGKYNAQNRPIQDLVTFNEIGIKEFNLNWANLLDDLSDTPVEPIQTHYMRVAKPQGRLAQNYPNAWDPDLQKLTMAVMTENRRYQKIRNPRLVKQLSLRREKGRWKCDDSLSEITDGLDYQQMVELAQKANFRHALWQMGEAIADLFEQVVESQPLLQDLPINDNPNWETLAKRWKK
ncbi:MAG: hypothetical protein JKY95_01870 [Planctomycetaceae bacterium]|nr:hypothetical protein [Planctomycetaceae bacterium]